MNKFLRTLLSTDDWLARHPTFLLVAMIVLYVLTGTVEAMP